MGADRSMWPAVVASDVCDECGWDLTDVADGELARLMAEQGPAWEAVVRPAPPDRLRWRAGAEVWSALEYCAHTRGVLEVFAARVERMLVEHAPALVVWDDEAAVDAEAYNEQDPAEVVAGLAAAAAAYAEVLERVPAAGWARTGLRDEDVFTVSGMTRYGLHESTHHRADAVRWIAAAG